MGKTIGQQIAARRGYLRMTQEELASRLDVSLRTVGGWERTSRVPRKWFGLIEEVLGMPTGALGTDAADDVSPGGDDVYLSALEAARRGLKGDQLREYEERIVRIAWRERLKADGDE